MKTNVKTMLLLLSLALCIGWMSGCGDDDDSGNGPEWDAGFDAGDADSDTDADTDADADADTDTDADTDADAGADASADASADGGDTDTATKKVTATVKVPSDFSAKPTFLYCTYYKNVPPTTAPDGIGAMIPTPVIDGDTSYELSANQAKLTGDYYVAIALLVQGGGTMQPVANKDFMYTTPNPVTLGGADVALGEVELALYTGK